MHLNQKRLFIASAMAALFLSAGCGGGGGARPSAGGEPSPPMNSVSGPIAVASVESERGFDGESPRFVSDALDNGLVVYLRTEGGRKEVFARRFDAATRTFGETTRLSSPREGSVNLLVLRLQPDGRAVVAWTQFTQDAPSRGTSNVRLRVYEPARQQWSELQRITAHPSHPDATLVEGLDAGFGPQDLPTVSWTEKSESEPNGFRVMTVRSDARMSAWGEPEVASEL